MKYLKYLLYRFFIQFEYGWNHCEGDCEECSSLKKCNFIEEVYFARKSKKGEY